MIIRNDFPKLWAQIDIKDDIREKLIMHAEDILASDKFHLTSTFIQHGDVSVYEHCLMVAACAIKINEQLKIKCNERALIRGALLHDYFLYDWHEKSWENSIHGYTHPTKSLKNACHDFDLSAIERDMIKHHMFPLTPTPPRCREGALLCIADKFCALKETLKGKGELKKKRALNK